MSAGTLSSAVTITRARIGGSIQGGAIGSYAGIVTAGAAGITQLVVGGSIYGSSGALYSGVVYSAGPIGSAVVGGSVIGSTGFASGSISALSFGVLNIGSDLAGGIGRGSGSVNANGRIATLRAGRILAGDGPFSGALQARSLGSIAVRGDIVGTPTQPVIIAAAGGATPAGPRAIASLTVGGNMSGTLVLGGYAGTTPVNGAARIGAVTVRGDMTSSSIVAGVRNPIASPTGIPQFGNGSDQPIAGPRGSRIDSLVVSGWVDGSTIPGESFAVVANSIGTVQLGGRPYTVTRAGIAPSGLNLFFQLIG